MFPAAQTLKASMVKSISEQHALPTVLSFYWAPGGYSAVRAGVFGVRAQVPSKRGSIEDVGVRAGICVPQESSSDPAQGASAGVLPRREEGRTGHQLCGWVSDDGCTTDWLRENVQDVDVIARSVTPGSPAPG